MSLVIQTPLIKRLLGATHIPLTVVGDRVDIAKQTDLVRHLNDSFISQGVASVPFRLALGYVSPTLALCKWSALGFTQQIQVVCQITLANIGGTVYGGTNYYNLTVSSANATAGASAAQTLVLTMNSGAQHNTLPNTTLPSFILNYYSSDNHLELGMGWGGLSSGTGHINPQAYVSQPTDGSMLPTFFSTNGALTASPTTSLTLSLNNGTNKYSFATVSTASGGTTSGFV